jgi:hypothetical protein
MNKKALSQVMRELGKRGGKIGGKRAAANMSANERTERARKAGLASAKARRKKAVKKGK